MYYYIKYFLMEGEEKTLFRNITQIEIQKSNLYSAI